MPTKQDWLPKVEYLNLPAWSEPGAEEKVVAKNNLVKALEANPPSFLSGQVEVSQLSGELAEYSWVKNLILVGNGGSVWSFMAFAKALLPLATLKRVYALTDMEPQYLHEVMGECPVESTLVVVVSKSGSTIGVIENLIALGQYPKLFVTDPGSPIGQLAEYYQAKLIEHPVVGGRYTAFTNSAAVPSLIMGLDFAKILAGGQSAYAEYGISTLTDSRSNAAFELAWTLYQAELNGLTEIFAPIYSNYYETFALVLTQLIHESYGKAGQGPTILAVKAPESQHHTNQRYFGGRANMFGLFIVAESQSGSAVTDEIELAIPSEIAEIECRGIKLGQFNGLKLSQSFAAESAGTIGDATSKNKPAAVVRLPAVSPESVGAWMGFLHYFTVYSSLLRGVDPYDQPQVEDSKAISVKLRLDFSGQIT